MDGLVDVPAKTVRFGFYSLWMTCDANYSLMRTFIRAKSASVVSTYRNAAKPIYVLSFNQYAAPSPPQLHGLCLPSRLSRFVAV